MVEEILNKLVLHKVLTVMETQVFLLHQKDFHLRLMVVVQEEIQLT